MMERDDELLRGVSWLIIHFLMVSSLAFAVAAMALAGALEEAAQAAYISTLALFVMFALEISVRVFSVDKLVQGAARRIVPKRWLGEEVN